MTTKDTKDLTIVPPHAVYYLRSIINISAQQLKEGDTSATEVPTLLERARAFVNRDRYLTLLTTKKGNE